MKLAFLIKLRSYGDVGYIFHSLNLRYFIAGMMKVIIWGAECEEVNLGQIQAKYQTFLKCKLQRWSTLVEQLEHFYPYIQIK